MWNKNTLLIRAALVAVFLAIFFSLYLSPRILNRKGAQDASGINTHEKVTLQTIRKTLKNIQDPEIGVNVVDLGLIKDVRLKGNGVSMSLILTSPLCPYVDVLIYEIKQQIKKINSIEDVEVNIDLDTVWNPDMMTEEGRKQLEGFGNAP